MQPQCHDPSLRNDGNLKKRVGTRWRGHFYKPTLEPTQVRLLCALFPHHLAAKTRMSMVRIGFRKFFPQMSFHACTHDMLSVGCHARMLGRIHQCRKVASIIGNFNMDNTMHKINYRCEMCYFYQKWDTRWWMMNL